MTELDGSFFRRDPVACARELVGATFIWHGCAGRIVETEATAAGGIPREAMPTSGEGGQAEAGRGWYG